MVEKMNFANDEERIAFTRNLIKRNKTLNKVKKKSKVARKIALQTRDNGLPEWAKDNGENIYSYNDESKYADEYYGETMRETIKLDNDWD